MTVGQGRLCEWAGTEDCPNKARVKCTNLDGRNKPLYLCEPHADDYWAATPNCAEIWLEEKGQGLTMKNRRKP